MLRAQILLTALLLCMAPGAGAAVIFNTVGNYDEQVHQVNAVKRNANGDALSATGPNDVAGFTTDVASAFSSGHGGVANFDLPNSSDADVTNDLGGMTLQFGSGTKSLSANQSGIQYNYSTITGATPISGTATASRAFTPSSTLTNFFDLAFGSIAGGEPGEAVVRVGFTVLSRPYGSNPQNMYASVSFSNATSQSRIVSMSPGTGVDDVFYGFSAPDGASIKRFEVIFQGSATDRRPVIDDLGFITANVPEPASGFVAIGMLASLAFMTHRRPRCAN